MMEKIRQLKAFIRDQWVLFLVLISIIAPSIWGLASLYYMERIETLKERVNLAREEKNFCDDKIKSPTTIYSKGISKSSTAARTPQTVKLTTYNVGVIYPPIDDPNQLTRLEVRNLARFYGLFGNWRVNPHLQFNEGDISYWHEQGMSEEELRLEFMSRRIILQRAEVSKEKIASQGDLSHKAEQIQAQLLVQ